MNFNSLCLALIFAICVHCVPNPQLDFGSTEIYGNKNFDNQYKLSRYAAESRQTSNSFRPFRMLADIFTDGLKAGYKMFDNIVPQIDDYPGARKFGTRQQQFSRNGKLRQQTTELPEVYDMLIAAPDSTWWSYLPFYVATPFYVALGCCLGGACVMHNTTQAPSTQTVHEKRSTMLIPKAVL